MLLHDLTIENYRSFAKYKLSNLARVNLLVGDNNCGKTSVLEAVALLASEGDMGALLRTLELREDIESIPIPGGPAYHTVYDGRSLFHFGEVAQDYDELTPIHFFSSGNDHRNLKIRVQAPTASEPAELVFTLNGSTSSSIRMDGHGRLVGPWISGMRWTPQGQESTPMFVFVPAGGLTSYDLSGLWQALLKSSREHIAIQVMRVLHEGITGIVFSPATEHRRDVLIEINGERDTLARYGAGTSSLLSIAIAIASIRNGCLLIDEIDTGLHYLRLSDMWRMVLKTAAELDVQVFATTHSLDCIRALAEAVENEPALADEVAIFRIDRRFEEAVHFGGDALSVIVNHEIEVR